MKLRDDMHDEQVFAKMSRASATEVQAPPMKNPAYGRV